MKRFAALFLAIIMVLSFSACGGESDILGLYVFESAEEGLSVLTDEALSNMGFTPEEYYRIELREDNACRLESYDAKASGTYEISGGSIVIVIDGSVIKGELSGGKITFEKDGAKIVLSKQAG